MGKRKMRNRTHKRKKHKVQTHMRNMIIDWAGLPRDILVKIFEQLTLLDCISVDSICKQWRSALSELPCWKRCGLPWLLMSGQKDREMRTCISVLEDRVWEIELPEAYGGYIWGSFQDWLILVKDLGCYSLEISLLNPFSSRKIGLPGIWSFYHKMVLSGLPSDKNFICMLLHSECRELAYWVRGSQSWHKSRFDGAPFEDAVFCNGSFFLLSNDYNIWKIDAAGIFSTINGNDIYASGASEIKIEIHEVKIPETFSNNDHVLRYLVESSGEVLLVCRFYNENPGAILETLNFEIYLLDITEMSWKKVENLGDLMLFLGKCCSRSFSSKVLGVGASNCIYFSNDDAAPWWNEWDSDHLKGMCARLGLDNSDRNDWGTFSFDHDNHRNFCFRGKRDSWAPVWFTVPLWWYRNNLFKRAKSMGTQFHGDLVKVRN